MSRIMATAHAPRRFARTAELALLLLLATLWGASYTFIKLGVESIPPVTLIAARRMVSSRSHLTRRSASGFIRLDDTWESIHAD